MRGSESSGICACARARAFFFAGLPAPSAQVTAFRALQLTQSLGHRSQGLAVTVEVTLGQHGRHQSQDGPQGAALLAAAAPGATRFLERVHATLQLDQTLSDAGVLQKQENTLVSHGGPWSFTQSSRCRDTGQFKHNGHSLRVF